MMAAHRFDALPTHAFARLRTLLGPVRPGAAPLAMTLGEPQHPMPDFVAEVMAQQAGLLAHYPQNDGNEALLQAISGWLLRRFTAQVGPERLMALNGTREGLYNAAMALCPGGREANVLIPNPFYQVYAVAALSIGATPVYVPATAQSGYLPDYAALPAAVLNATQAAYICTPSNPQGAIASRTYLKDLLTLAERYDFLVFADECYSEIYRDQAPPGCLDVAQQIGADPERLVVFNSLSKRSNLPGLRSGFVASGPANMARLRQLRAYAGAPLPGPLQAVAARAWQDETHVERSRALYVEKYAVADRILGDLPGYSTPNAGPFLWVPVPDGEDAAVRLWQTAGIRVLPGAYLGRETDGCNPGAGYIRVAIVPPVEEVESALTRMRACLFEAL